MATLGIQQWGPESAQQQIILLHGWGMNSGVWTDIAMQLSQHYSDKLILAVDLPGYGHSANYDLDDLDGEYSASSLATSLIPLLQKKVTTLIAWSMGGLVAIELASQKLSQKLPIEQLILVSSTPCFVQSKGWDYAVEAKLFEDFCQSLVEDHQATLKRFLAIQTLGSRTAREDIKTLQSHLFERGSPDHKALEFGLQMLLKEDKRMQLSQLTDIPIHLICGQLDTLVNYKGQKQLAAQDNISLMTLKAAGHAPFISHPNEFTQLLYDVL